MRDIGLESYLSKLPCDLNMRLYLSATIRLPNLLRRQLKHKTEDKTVEKVTCSVVSEKYEKLSQITGMHPYPIRAQPTREI